MAAGTTAMKQILTYGQRPPPGTGATGSENPNLMPAFLFGGSLLVDPIVGYNVTRRGAIGFGGAHQHVLTFAPATKATNAIALAQATTISTPMTLTASTGFALLGTATQFWNSSNTIAATVWTLGGAPALLSFGSVDPGVGGSATDFAAYDPSTMLSRCVSVTATNGGATGGIFTVVGYDIYGNAMSEAITHAGGATTASGKKAFKFITSVTPNFTDAQTYAVGTLDLFGLPLRTASVQQAMVWWNSALLTSLTTFVAAVTTDPATTTTGDVRGTIGVPDAADGSKILSVSIRVPPDRSISKTGLFGVSQA
jgi:hypothetical protein